MKNFLLLLIALCISTANFSQAVSWELSAEPGDQLNSPGTNNNASFTNNGLSRGAGLTAVTGAGSMNSSGWFSGSSATTLADAIANNDYYEFTINSINCLFFNPTTIVIVLRSSATGPNTATLRSSSDGFTADIGTVAVTTTSVEKTFSDVITPNNQSTTFRLYGYGGAAGGGTPSSGGTMRIGSSVVAGDNDIKFFSTTTQIEVSAVPNITVSEGDAVPATVLTANVPGATITWTRTPEDIANPDLATNGTGNVPSFTAENISSPISSTFSATASLNGCVSVEEEFVITLETDCQFSEVNFSGSTSPCNDNGTPNDPSDDFFTKDVRVTFINPPLTGDLQIVPGGDQIGTYSIPRNQIIGLLHIFDDVKFKADGTQTVAQVNWTVDPDCIAPVTGNLVVDPCSNGGTACEIIGFSFNNIGQCNDNGTGGDDSDDFFEVDVDVLFSNTASNHTLRITGPDVVQVQSVPAPIGTNITHTFNNVRLRADGQITDISADIRNSGLTVICSLPGTGPAVNSCSNGQATCSITDIIPFNQGPCDDNGTNDVETDDFFTLDVTVEFENPPTTGLLGINLGPDFVPGGGDPDVPVSDLVGNSHTFTGIRYRADGNTTSIRADFTADANCTASVGTTITVEPCSFLPPVLTCPAAVTVSCANNVAPANPASVSETHTCPGNVTITHSGDAISNQLCPNRLTITRTYLGVDNCNSTATCSQIITVDDQVDPVLTCPINVTVSCASNVPPTDANAVTNESDNCGGTVQIFPQGDNITNQTCPNKFTILRTYFAVDACNNSNNCIQTITVNDQTGPIITCPAAQTVSCAEQVPPPNPALVTGTDNCGGTITPSFFSGTVSNQTCINRFILTRQYRAADVCGNTSSCTQVITVNDQTPPVFTFVPANTTVDCYLIPPVGIATASDNCNSGATVAFLGQTEAPGVCPVWKILTRSWRATDACGNSTTASQVISVTDFNAPQFIVAAKDLFVECGPDNAAQLQQFKDNFGGAVVQDCAQITYSYEISPIEIPGFDCGNTFRQNVRFIATDECLNTSYQDALFRSVDSTPPVFSTPPQTVAFECEESIGVAEIAFYDWLDSDAGLVVEDACGSVTLEKVFLGESSGCGNTWRKNYEFRATDQCGNITKVKAYFAVVDNTPPVIECPPNDNVYLPCIEDVPPADPSSINAYDCNGVTMTLNETWTNGTGCPNFPMTVAYRYAARDACGNESVCERAYYVKETTTPTLICPDTLKLICVDDIPGPQQLFDYIKNLIKSDCDGGFSSIKIKADSGAPQNGAMHRTYTITAKNHCQLVTSACSVTFLAVGNCKQLCTASQSSWGDPNGTIASMSCNDAIDQLIAAYGPVRVGAGGHTLTAHDADCVQTLLFGSGGLQPLPTGHHSCPLPASLSNPDGSLNNQLAANAMALQLNIWYNQKFNDRNLGIQDIHNLPNCLVDFALQKILAQQSSVQDILNLTNLYLQNLGATNEPELPELLNLAMDNLNFFRENCGLNAPCEKSPIKVDRNAGNPKTSFVNRLSPNPTTESALLEFYMENEGPVEVQVADARGIQSMFNITAAKGTNFATISLNSLPSGVYWVVLKAETNYEVMRLLKAD